MKIIRTKKNGVFGLVVGIILIVSPWLLGFATNRSEMWIPIALGISAILYSIITDYEVGVFKILPIKFHLIVDTLSGILLASSPWLFGFSDKVYLPHLLFGLLELVVVILTHTNTTAYYKQTRHTTSL